MVRIGVPSPVGGAIEEGDAVFCVMCDELVEMIFVELGIVEPTKPHLIEPNEIVSEAFEEAVISKKNSPLHGLTKGSLWNNITTGSDANVTVVTLFVLLHGEQNESLTSSSESIIDSLSEQVALTFVSFTNNALIVILRDEVEDEAVSRQEH